MKQNKLKGFGSLGVQITDINLETCTTDQIVELGKIVAEQLVVLVDVKEASISPERFWNIQNHWGDTTGNTNLGEVLKIKKELYNLDPEDLRMLDDVLRFTRGLDHLPGMIRVTGEVDKDGNHTGMFADGELMWHSDRQGTCQFSPLIGLQAWSGTEGTCTEFLQTADAYDGLNQDMQTMIDELIAVHRYNDKESIAPGVNLVQDNVMKMNMCPIDDSEVPFGFTSPSGIKGVRFNYLTIDHFKGMSKKESQKLLEELKGIFLQEKYSYRQNWQDGQICWMDQTITLHRRPTLDCSKRVLHRLTSNMDRLYNKKTSGTENLGKEPGVYIDGKKISNREFVERLRVKDSSEDNYLSKDTESAKEYLGLKD